MKYTPFNHLKNMLTKIEKKHASHSEKNGTYNHKGVAYNHSQLAQNTFSFYHHQAFFFSTNLYRPEIATLKMTLSKFVKE